MQQVLFQPGSTQWHALAFDRKDRCSAAIAGSVLGVFMRAVQRQPCSPALLSCVLALCSAWTRTTW
jgi:hypothetical protein